MAVNTTKKGGVYIEINGTAQPLYDVLNSVKGYSQSVANSIPKTFNGAFGSIDASSTMNGVTREFARLKTAMQGVTADTSQYKSQFQEMGKQIGLTTMQARAFGETMSVAFQKQAANNVTSALKAIQREAGLTQKGLREVASTMGAAKFMPSLSGGASSSMFSGLTTGAIGAALSIGGVITTLKTLTDSMLTMSRLTTSYQSIYGSQYGATQQLDQIYNQTQAVGLQFQQTAQAAKTFFAAAQDSTLASEANNIFNAVAKGAAALQMSTDDVNGVFLALGQMISKGKVQAEELRGQLGERLPGAFQLAAKAMNMSTAELDKFMADGKLTAEDLLPKLAQALEEKYAAAATKAANSVQGSINRMTTEWELFKASVLDSDAVVRMLNRVTGALAARNEASAKDKERNALISNLQGMGIGPDATGVSYDVQGNQVEGKYYSDNLLNSWRNFNAGLEAENQITEQREKEREAILNRANSSLKTFLKNSKEDKISNLTQERDTTLKAIQDAIDVRQETGVGADDLISQRTRVLAEYQSQLEKLNKEAGGKGLANKQFKFDTGLEQLRQEVANMEATINPASLGIEKLRNKLELEKQNALAAAEAHAKLSVQRKEATPAEAEEKKSLEVRKAELTYTQKLAEAEEKGRQTRVEFYKDFAELSGNYTESLQAQAEAIAKQGEEYRNAGIPEQLERQWEALKKLQTARDPMSGTVRGLRKYANEATDLARGMEDVWGNAFKGMEDAIVTFAQTGKMSFTDMANSIIADLIRIAVRSSITGPLASGIGNMFSGMFGSWTTSASTGSAIDSAVGWVHHTGGMVGDGSAPTRSVPMSAYAYAPRFHSGGGFGQEEYPAVLLRGERVLNRDEARGYNAAMALARGNTFRDSFVSPSGYGSSNQQPSQPQVYLNINNSTGEQVSQQVKTDNNGNIRADIWVGNTAAKQMAKPGTAANQTLRSGLGIKQRAIGR